MVDAARVTRLLRSLDEGLAALQRRRDALPDERDSEVWLLAVKYLFVTTIESCIDIAQHLCSTERLGVPADNADAVRRLGEAEIIDRATASGLAAAVGFRNVLVHGYVSVDDAIVLRRLDDHLDLVDFARQVGTWLLRQHP